MTFIKNVINAGMLFTTWVVWWNLIQHIQRDMTTHL